MNKVEKKLSYEMNVAPEKAWDVIGSVGGVDKWFNSLIKACRVEDGKRFCETADGVKLEEDILEVDHVNRVFRFAIPTQELLPVENIEESMKVLDGAGGKAVIEWTATFDATEENGEIAKEAFQNMWTMGLQEMEAYINNQN